MYYIRKLKPDRSVTGLLPAFISVAIFALTSVIFDLTVGFSVLGVLIGLYALYSFIAYLKTSNWAYIIASLYQLSLALLIWSQPRTIKYGNFQLTNVFLVFTVIFLVWMIYLFINKKLKWRGREILEMAAEPVDEIADGYTARPLSS